jgi:hypothetical protein
MRFKVNFTDWCIWLVQGKMFERVVDERLDQGKMFERVLERVVELERLVQEKMLGWAAERAVERERSVQVKMFEQVLDVIEEKMFECVVELERLVKEGCLDGWLNVSGWIKERCLMFEQVL